MGGPLQANVPAGSGLPAFDWPASRGLLGWAMPPAGAGSSGTVTLGLIELVRMYVPVAGLASKLYLHISTGGSVLTANQNFAGLYDGSGNLLGLSADQSTNWLSTGLQTMTLTAQALGLQLLGSTFYYAAILVNGTTSPTFQRGPSWSNALNNLGLTLPALMSGQYSVGGQTSLLNPLATASWVGNAQGWWAAVG